MTRRAAIRSDRGRDGLPPGPLLPPAVQRLAWAERPIGFASACQARFGDVFTLRFGRHLTLVVVSDPDLAAAVFADEPAVLRRGEAPSRRRVLGETSVGVTGGAVHAETRAALRPVLAAGAADAQRDAIARLTVARAERWPRERPFALLPELRELVREVLAEVLVGETADLRHRAAIAAAFLAVDEARRDARPSVPVVRRVWGPGTPTRALTRAVATLDALLQAEIDVRRPAATVGQDLLAGLCAARFPDGRRASDAWVRDQLVTLYLTGHDLMWSALGWTFERLLREPGVLDRLRRAPRGSQAGAAAVREVLRVRPPAWLTGARIPSAPYALGDFTLPAGTLITACTALIHHHEAAFEEPTAFRPERFVHRPSPPAWIPFGGGPRRCAAEHLALLAAQTAFEAAVAAVDLRPARSGAELQREVGTVFLPAGGVRVVVGR